MIQFQEVKTDPYFIGAIYTYMTHNVLACIMYCSHKTSVSFGFMANKLEMFKCRR